MDLFLQSSQLKSLVLSFRFLEPDKRAGIGLQCSDNYRAKHLNNTYILKSVTSDLSPRLQIQNFHFGLSLKRALNNICQVINRLFPVNDHDIIILSRLPKCTETPEMHKMSRDKRRAFYVSAV